MGQQPPPPASAHGLDRCHRERSLAKLPARAPSDVESTAGGQADLYGVADQGVTPLETLAVSLHSRARNTDAGGVTLRHRQARRHHGRGHGQGADHRLRATL